MFGSRLRLCAFAIFVVGAVVYGLSTATSGWADIRASSSARDFASYFYALEAAFGGGSPYDTGLLGELARFDGTRGSVYPYFYPPPYLLAMAWALPLNLATAYGTFFWLGSISLGLVMWALWRWQPSAALLSMAGVVLATFSPIANSHRMGQANLLMLAILIWGLILAEREGRRSVILGGVLVGYACMMKMSPAIFVMWWLVRKKNIAVGAAVATALVSSIVALPLVGLEHQLEFYLEVLPGFASGNYHDLSVPLNIPANHSWGNLWMQITSGFRGLPRTAPPTDMASTLASVTSLATLGALFWRLRAREQDPTTLLCSIGAFISTMVLFPAYTYEHHLVYMLIPIAAVVTGAKEGRFGLGWISLFFVAYVLLAWPLPGFKETASSLGLQVGPWAKVAMLEAKSFAVVAMGLTCFVGAISSAGSPIET
jgi:hypothetical protein